MFRKFLLTISVGMALFGAAIVANATFSGTPPTETFDGNPVAPAPFSDSEWDIQVHSRDPGTWYALEGIDAQHGADCSAPPATHHNTSYEGAVFQCRDHVMTAINAGGYGAIYLTPNRLVDFSNGATIQFDLSTLRMSLRDWVDIWITPYDDNLALPFDNGDVDLQGMPRKGLHITMSAFNGETTFRCYRIDNFVQEELNGSHWWLSVDSLLAGLGRQPSATVRDTFRLDLSPGSLKFSLPVASDGNWGGEFCNTTGEGGIGGSLGFTKGVVQFGHHSYTPSKDGAGVPATWHWDNVSIEPSEPFSIIQADRRYVDGEQTVNFASPAPAGSSLRFSANGVVEVNFGSGWQAARIQPAQTNVDRTRSYWMPIPAGTQAVQFRGQDTSNGPFFAKDFSIWSLSTSVPPSTPTSSPTNTVTPTIPATAPSTSTATPSPTSTATPIPPTPIATSTPTPVNNRCTVRDRNDANTGWVEREGTWVEAQPGLWACLVPKAGRVP